MSADSYAGDVNPSEAWSILSEDPKAVLIDCRTQPEWTFVGVPDLGGLGKETLFVPWQVFPTMQQNPAFGDGFIAARLIELLTTQIHSSERGDRKHCVEIIFARNRVPW